MSLDAAERAVRDGDLDLALTTLQDQVRKSPERPELRVFLFQLLCVQGQWQRALTQLDVAGELDAANLPMVQMYREAIHCEQLRADVFAGRRSPLVFGEPEPWLAWLIEALANSAETTRAEELRAQAFEAAAPTAGTIDGHAFEWIADADMRLGPVCEAVVNGRYYWIPFARLARLDIEAPADLRDVVWMPAVFRFVNGGEVVGTIPTRYPQSETAADPRIRLARATEWRESPQGVFLGTGQRIIATDAGEYPVMDVRVIAMGADATGAAGA